MHGYINSCEYEESLDSESKQQLIGVPHSATLPSPQGGYVSVCKQMNNMCVCVWVKSINWVGYLWESEGQLSLWVET